MDLDLLKAIFLFSFVIGAVMAIGIFVMYLAIKGGWLTVRLIDLVEGVVVFALVLFMGYAGKMTLRDTIILAAGTSIGSAALILLGVLVYPDIWKLFKIRF